MKKYYVTVNGNRYEVEIEEVKGDFAPRAGAVQAPAPVVTPEPRAEVKAQAQEEVREAAKEEVKEVSKPVSAGNAEGEAIECPMPGTILKVIVSEGSSVKKGDVMFILEAMKMENEIMAPRDGKVVQVKVAKGAVVNTGDVLGVLQ